MWEAGRVSVVWVGKALKAPAVPLTFTSPGCSSEIHKTPQVRSHQTQTLGQAQVCQERGDERQQLCSHFSVLLQSHSTMEKVKLPLNDKEPLRPQGAADGE